MISRSIAMTKKTICLNMIVKNEAHLIAETLAHLLTYITFDYWVISDTGSTDATKEIIINFFKSRKIPGELVEHAWQDFGYNRSKAFEAAYNKTDYAFVWDADDEISGSFKMPADLTADSYMFTFGNSDGFRYSRHQLFNNRKRWCYKGVLHEYAACLEAAGPSMTVSGDYFFISGRRGDRSKDPNKYLKDAVILERAAEKALAEKDPLYNRYIFYCAQSYASCNMHEQAIKFYKLALTIDMWVQEKYVSCIEIYEQYEHMGKAIEGLPYLIESYKYDKDRIECIFRLIRFYCINGQVEVSYMYYSLIQDFYENKYEGSKIGEKLFAKKSEYDFYLPYYMIITAEKTRHLDTAAKMYEIIVKNEFVVGEWWIRNLVFNIQFCISALPKSLDFFYKLMDYLKKARESRVSFEPVQINVISRLIDHYRPLLIMADIKPYGGLTSLVKPLKVMMTFTSCKRLDLFQQTINSILNSWIDLDKVDYFFCVDDNSSQRDRTKMRTMCPFIDFHMKRKGEKGHRASMNIIYNKLKEMQPTYWIHMEDDWVFFERNTYVQKSIDFLDRFQNKGIHQILYNRNYAETYDGWEINGSESLDKGFLLHVKSDNIPGRNCAYWPHYSFRPSMIRVSTIMELGNYDSPNTFFERDYADKYFAKGYKSAFFDTVSSLHIGKLTSDKTGQNAYTMNGVGQFDLTNKSASNTFVVNLLRRTDRKECIETAFDVAGIKESEYEFIEAVDGRDLVVTDEISKLFAGNDFGSRKGFIGCALSHYNLWKQLVADTSNDFYTIFEDDIKLADGFKEKWLNAKATIDLTKPHFLYLGFTSPDKAVKLASTEKIDFIDMGKYIGGFFGYMITKSAAQLMCDYIQVNGIKHGIDYLVKVVPNIRCLSVQPHIVLSEWVTSPSSSVDTDIQKDYSSLQLSIAKPLYADEWIFYEGVDSGGSDIGCLDKDINALKAAASADQKCVAFNTLGFLKSYVKFPLSKSPWLQAPHGIYVKKSYKPPTRVKMLCNWCSSEDLCKEWLKMCKGLNTYKWNDIEITWSDDNIDYYVIINKPQPGAKYVPEKTIIFHMEPWCSDDKQNWGVKTWGEWAKPDPMKFMQVRSHDTYLNPGFWQLNLTYSQLKEMDMVKYKYTDKSNIISSICSSKYFDPGHKKRIDFLKFLEAKSDIHLHIYNEDNQHGFKSYQGTAKPSIDKEKGLVPYKYYFMCENNAEKNFITEKLWEPILCEALCFYWGCPNVVDYIDPLAYVKLNMDNFEAAYRTIKACIQTNLWQQRLPYIKKAKQRILDEQGFFPVLERALKPKVICFIHSCHLATAGTEKLDLILDSVLKVKELEAIIINNIGLPLDSKKYVAMDSRIQVLQCSSDPALFEIPTLRLIQEFSETSPNTKILYLHTKGISYAKGDPRYGNGLDWINYMLHFLCSKSEDCLRLLDSHDVTGCNFSEAPKPHFSGNFWWATSKHLKTLDKGLLTDKMSAEWWLLSKPVKKASLWQSDKNHFHERYPKEEYNISIKLFIVFHSMLFNELYSEMSDIDKHSVTMYGVKSREESEFKTIYEADLPIYNPKLQANVYNEGSAFYHIYKNNLYNDCDYIGFGQYDMKIQSNTFTSIRSTINSSDSPCIFVMDYFPDIKKTGYLGSHNLIKSDLNGLESGLKTYNRMFNKRYTPEDVLQNRLIMCNTFVIHKVTFEKLMSWLIQYYRDDINVNRHKLIGNAGEIPEVLIGMFLSLEVLEGAKYHKFNVEHIWPLYKNKVNMLNYNAKLASLHAKLKINHGSFDQEYPEQLMSAIFLKGDEKVLELGANIGRNTLVIASLLKDSKNLVSLECDIEIAAKLKENRDLNGMNFHIEASALSKRPLIQKGWDTIVSHTILDGYSPVNTITYDRLIEKYGLAFDTLVLDCEGALYYILIDMPEVLKGIKLIIMENDYHDIEHKKSVDTALIASGLQCTYRQAGGWGPCADRFFEVWQKST
jgi:FkbM family methyltransferase